MNDDMAIAKLMGLEGDGVPIIYTDEGNPFQSYSDLANEGRVTGNRSFSSDGYQQQRDEIRHMSLLQRTDQMRPKIRALSRPGRSSRPAQGQGSEIARPFVQSLRSVAGKHRRQHMSEFIQQKREIFLFQLFIDRKEKKIRNLQREEQNGEKWIRAQEKEIGEGVEDNKLTTVQLEASLARSQRLAEAAAQETATMMVRLHSLEKARGVIRSDILKNEDLLDVYRPYQDFLMKFLPPGETIENYFTHPGVLISELEKLDSENLFVITHCQHLESILAHGVEKVNKELIRTIQQEQEVMVNIGNIRQVKVKDYSFSPTQKKAIQETEQSLAKFEKLIKKAYQGCFNSTADLGPLIMLGAIQDRFEEMADLCEKVTPEFLAQKRMMRDRSRRALQRRDWQHQRELDQQRKLEQAIQRARRPRKWRLGKTLVKRMLPWNAKVMADLSQRLKGNEQRQEYKFLYGDSDDDW